MRIPSPRPPAPCLLLAALLAPGLAIAQAPASAATAPTAAVDASAAAKSWAFRPLVGAPALTPADIDGPIDAALLAAGLQRSARADPRTLLRRAAFALTGLPPTAAEVAAFASEPSDGAFAAAVDRLLASPQYGEHQARLWLDLARYSDSNGVDENLAYATAWRYRDWVVRAANQDLPFDRFGTLQIAGDLLPVENESARQDALVATGFLALGPKLLAEQDKEKLVLDTVDEQIDLVGRTFLGLTLGCARCHDHKFDPIPTRDYYALAGIFKSSTVFENLDHVSRWVEQPLASAAEVAVREARVKTTAACDQRLGEARTRALAAQPRRLCGQIGRALVAGRALAGHAIAAEAEDATATNLHRDAAHWGGPGCVVLHTQAGGVQFAEYAIDVPQDGAWRLDVRLASEESRPLRVLVDGKEQLASVLAVTTGGWFPAQQRWFVAGRLQLAKGPHVLALQGLLPNVPHLDRWLLLPAPPAPAGTAPPLTMVRNAMLAVLDETTALGRQFQALGGDGVALAAAFGDAAPPAGVRELAARWQLQFETVHQAWRELLAQAEQDKRAPPKGLPAPSLERLRQQLLGPGGLLDLGEDELLQTLPAAEAKALAGLTKERDAAAAAVPPAPSTAMCAREAQPTDLPVHIRGNHLALGKEAVPRGFPSLLDAVLPPPPVPPGHSGRLELAQWLFDPRNPLTARVLANRVWLWLFGQGLVRSPSNFGARGEAPSHPGLLDALALSLQQDGWSIKRLQRRILLSQTWQQESLSRADGTQQDPQDRWLWRQHRRRLPAEAIRDAVLQTAGTLDLTLGGSLLEAKDRDYVTNDQSNDKARYDSPRRSLYLPVIRNAMYDSFTAFDYADPSVHLEQRPESAVAPQALLLLNSPFVLAQSEAFARAALAAAGDDELRIDWIWQRALQRQPRADEAAAARRYLERARAQDGAGADELLPWRGLCQATLCTNEFVYVD